MDLIVRQEVTLDNYDNHSVKTKVEKTKAAKEETLEEEHNIILQHVDEDTKRNIQLATEKGAGAWLTALPVQAYGYVLNKRDFRDSICMRYGWKIPNIPSHCSCNKKNTVDHILNCKQGGFVIMRHNEIRDLEAELLGDICKDVRIEPELLPVGNVSLPPGANIADKARLDTASLGLFSPFERNFTDVRISNFNSPSLKDKTPAKLYELHEKEKMRKYNQRVIQVEKGTFTPLVFNTNGGMGPQATRFHKKIAEKISHKRNESYADVMKHIRTRLRFTVLRGTLTAIHGDRGRKTRHHPISEMSYNLIPESYEVF